MTEGITMFPVPTDVVLKLIEVYSKNECARCDETYKVYKCQTCETHDTVCSNCYKQFKCYQCEDYTCMYCYDYTTQCINECEDLDDKRNCRNCALTNKLRCDSCHKKPNYLLCQYDPDPEVEEDPDNENSDQEESSENP